MTTPEIDDRANAPYAPSKSQAFEDLNSYRVINKAAVFSIVLFIFGLLGLLFPGLLILAIAGVFLGISGWRSIVRYPEEFTGLKLAFAGMGLNAFLFVGGLIYHVVDYATEVPEGFERVPFSELQTPSLAASANMVPRRAVEVNNQKIFTKGYVHPGVDGMGKVKEFVLVPDMQTCCFGGQPKMTDMIYVRTTDECRVEYRRRLVKLAGTFHLGDHVTSEVGLKNVLYRLEATYSK
jgi:hypothetical protein